MVESMVQTTPLAEIDAEYVAPADRRFVAERIALERARLVDPEHLVRCALRESEFDWDFEPIGPGFLDLATPFLAEPSGAAALFHACLREYGIEESGARHAAVIVEFVHFATRMSDHFNYHDAFAETTPVPAIAERLVQVRYAAQWLNNYPRWLIVSNAFETSPAARIAIHGWGHQSFTTTGISRACFVSYAHRRFRGVTTANWLALAQGLLCELVISPAVMATMLAERSPAELAAVKRAFSHLAVALKARLERRSLARPSVAADPPELDYLVPMRFPGVAVTRARPEIDPALVSGSRFPFIRKTCAALAGADVVRAGSDETAAELRRLEKEHAGRFLDELRSARVLPRAACLATAFERE